MWTSHKSLYTTLATAGCIVAGCRYFRHSFVYSFVFRSILQAFDNSSLDSGLEEVYNDRESWWKNTEKKRPVPEGHCVKAYMQPICMLTPDDYKHTKEGPSGYCCSHLEQYSCSSTALNSATCCPIINPYTGNGGILPPARFQLKLGHFQISYGDGFW